MLVSTSTILLLVLLFYGPNKDFSYLVRGADRAALTQTVSFLAFDVAVELLLFVCLASYVQAMHGVHIVAAGLEYVRQAELRGPIICAFTAICLLNVGQTFDGHVGMDATFQFAWLGQDGPN